MRQCMLSRVSLSELQRVWRWKPWSFSSRLKSLVIGFIGIGYLFLCLVQDAKGKFGVGKPRTSIPRAEKLAGFSEFTQKNPK